MEEKTYNNSINEIEVSLGIERLLLGYYPTAWTPAKVDLAALPSGFYDLGCTVEDTPSFKVTRNKFSLQTGLPKITQYQAVIGLSGQLSISLHSNSWRKVQIAFGNYTASCSAVAVGSVSSVYSTGLTFVLSSTPTTPVVAGGTLIIETAGNADAIDALEVRIGSVNADGRTFTVSTQPYALKSISAGKVAYVYGVGYARTLIGGRSIQNYTILGVVDLIDGSQVVHYFKKCQPADDWTEEFRPEMNAKVPLTLDALGYTATVGACTENVVAERYQFPSTAGLCG